MRLLLLSSLILVFVSPAQGSSNKIKMNEVSEKHLLTSTAAWALCMNKTGKMPLEEINPIVMETIKEEKLKLWSK